LDTGMQETTSMIPIRMDLKATNKPSLQTVEINNHNQSNQIDHQKSLQIHIPQNNTPSSSTVWQIGFQKEKLITKSIAV
jgi:hypothetical protein